MLQLRLSWVWATLCLWFFVWENDFFWRLIQANLVQGPCIAITGTPARDSYSIHYYYYRVNIKYIYWFQKKLLPFTYWTSSRSSLKLGDKWSSSVYLFFVVFIWVGGAWSSLGPRFRADSAVPPSKIILNGKRDLVLFSYAVNRLPFQNHSGVLGQFFWFSLYCPACHE